MKKRSTTEDNILETFKVLETFEMLVRFYLDSDTLVKIDDDQFNAIRYRICNKKYHEK